jgi:hypothetical protein
MIDLPGTVGVVVINAPTSVSHRCPVYNAEQIQYGTFPFNRHVPPDKQYPTGQLTEKYYKIASFIYQSLIIKKFALTIDIHITISS